MFVIGGKDPIWRGKLFSSFLSSTALTGWRAMSDDDHFLNVVRF